MTDKQIIIDGVPVQDCCYFDYENDGYEDSCYIHQNECSAQNCYYKQLKRKEQELNDYKIQFEADSKEMEEYQNEIVRHLESIEYWVQQFKAKEQECEGLKKWLPIVTRLEMAFGSIETEKAKAIDYNTYAEEIFRQLDQLKAENKHLNDLLNQALKELEKTRETLTEIKEIAEEIGDECQLAPYGACALEAKDQILQKISECEGNND